VFRKVNLLLIYLNKTLHDNSQNQIDQEERAEYDDETAVNRGESQTICIHEVVHNYCPTVAGNHLDNSQESLDDVVKVVYSELNVCIGVHSVIFSRDSVLKRRATPLVIRTLIKPLVSLGTHSQVIFIFGPVGLIDGKLCQSAPRIHLATVLLCAKNGKQG
jgi:hypothetical protein